MKAEIYLNKSEVCHIVKHNLEQIIPNLKDRNVLVVEVEILNYSERYCTISISDEGLPKGLPE